MNAVFRVTDQITSLISRLNWLRDSAFLNVYVKQQILSKDEIQPSPSKRRFFPKPSDIRSHMYRASVEKRFSEIDQENVVNK